PLLEHESEFFAHHWRTHPLHASQFLRYLVTLLPPRPADRETTSEQAIIALGSRLIMEFVDTARQAGVQPLVVYLPTAADFEPQARMTLKERVLGELAARNIAVTDVTRCIAEEVPPE